MCIHGHVQNGVVVLDDGATLPEGTRVTVLPHRLKTCVPKKRRRVVLPLVKSDKPGSINLTAERIAQILEEEELSP
jgi:hypothetical protein